MESQPKNTRSSGFASSNGTDRSKRRPKGTSATKKEHSLPGTEGQPTPPSAPDISGKTKQWFLALSKEEQSFASAVSDGAFLGVFLELAISCSTPTTKGTTKGLGDRPPAKGKQNPGDYRTSIELLKIGVSSDELPLSRADVLTFLSPLTGIFTHFVLHNRHLGHDGFAGRL